ncbi:DUF192 domain-containing protein [Sphingobium boeckii]|uniref:DUF192 domain-containing protein n=1 Tax=Sphingobium boeckii TaxID=1082345 RepID=A0A7W9AH59_9SPHN|nr:DUF192 domain-containing protein [Sphingobium boeckii]MBB5685612.1 hypothetical protein [Sphingobium boeckii]
MTIAAALLACATITGCSGKASGDAALAVDDKTLLSVTILTAQGERTFRVEVARTTEAQAQGLMYRTELPEDGGMLFPSETPEPRTFWMKNTVIPLDIIFIRADGRIARIAEETVPQSLEPVPSLEPVTAVLEIAGGKSAALGIAAGDRVVWKDAAE